MLPVIVPPIKKEFVVLLLILKLYPNYNNK
jgi:hypothetical protein